MRRLAWLLVGCLALPASAGTIHLKDGTTVQGDIHKADDGYRVTSEGGVVTVISSEKIASIDVRASGTADSGVQRLASLRRAVDNIKDIKTILERYKSFIEQNTGTPIAKEAEQDAQMWRDRQTKGLVRFGGKWVTPAEQTALEGRSQGVAAELRTTIKSGRLKEAGTVLERALADNPQSVSLLYLRGVLRYREEVLPESRKSFESVLAVATDHAPTLNNLAVILWRQNAPAAALQNYDRAMQAAPGSRDILDNVAEALEALPEPERKSPVVKKVVRHFREQDDDLQKKMGERGYTRWGATWVSQEQFAKLQDEEKEMKSTLDQMSRDFDSTQARITSIDRTIKQVQQEMATIDAQSYAVDAKGNTFRLPLPPRYYELQRDLNTLAGERAVRVGDLDRLRRDAKTTKQKLSVAKYTGIQRLIDVDGMPMMALAAPPDTRPAAADVK